MPLLWLEGNSSDVFSEFRAGALDVAVEQRADVHQALGDELSQLVELWRDGLLFVAQKLQGDGAKFPFALPNRLRNAGGVAGRRYGAGEIRQLLFELSPAVARPAQVVLHRAQSSSELLLELSKSIVDGVGLEDGGLEAGKQRSFEVVLPLFQLVRAGTPVEVLRASIRSVALLAAASYDNHVRPAGAAAQKSRKKIGGIRSPPES